MGAQDAIEKLEAELATANAALQAQMEETSKVRHNAFRLQEEIAETREQFAELKERVATLGVQNAEMRGYIGRVQEDDTVREELVSTGDVQAGDVQLMPKRKHRNFDFHLYEAKASIMGVENWAPSGMASEGRTRARRHWVNY